MTALIDTYAQYPLELVSGAGSRVRTRDGRELWDLYGGHAVCALGHSHPEIADALASQARTLAFYSNVVPLEVRTRAAEALVAFANSVGDKSTPIGGAAHAGFASVFFCNSGAEANENALKLALQLTGRRKLAAIAGGWHGRTLLTLSATTDDKLTRPLDGALLPCVRLRPNDPADLAQLDHSIAAVMAEPIMSIAGIVELEPAYLQALRQRCTEIEAMLIYDEVQTGVGRLGRPYVAGAGGVWPDFSTSAKSLANGVPIGALLMAPAVAARVKQGDLGSTFGGGPLACAALLATLAVIERDGLLAHAARLGALCHERLHVGPVRAVLGRGCLIGLRVAGPAKRVQQTLLERGFITGTSADPSVLRLMPPLNTPVEALDELAAAMANSEL